MRQGFNGPLQLAIPSLCEYSHTSGTMNDYNGFVVPTNMIKKETQALIVLYTRNQALCPLLLCAQNIGYCVLIAPKFFYPTRTSYKSFQVFDFTSVCILELQRFESSVKPQKPTWVEPIILRSTADQFRKLQQLETRRHGSSKSKRTHPC